jgi:chromate transport protein ChrA
MFYFIAGLVVGGYLVYCGFMKVNCTTLVGICPIAIIVPGLAALVLFLKGEEMIASLVLVLGIALSTLMLAAIRKLLTRQQAQNSPIS